MPPSLIVGEDPSESVTDCAEGAAVVTEVGAADLDGALEGWDEGWVVGTAEGWPVGSTDGADEGWPVGLTDGADEGWDVGCTEGAPDGWTVGTPDGCEEGFEDGAALGSLEGRDVGAPVGALVGCGVGSTKGPKSTYAESVLAPIIMSGIPSPFTSEPPWTGRYRLFTVFPKEYASGVVATTTSAVGVELLP